MEVINKLDKNKQYKIQLFYTLKCMPKETKGHVVFGSDILSIMKECFFISQVNAYEWKKMFPEREIHYIKLTDENGNFFVLSKKHILELGEMYYIYLPDDNVYKIRRPKFENHFNLSYWVKYSKKEIEKIVGENWLNHKYTCEDVCSVMTESELNTMKSRLENKFSGPCIF